MRDASSTRRYHRAFMATVALLASTFQAHSTDVFTAPNVLTIPTLEIGVATFSNVVLTIGSIVTPPSGTSPNGFFDTYNPVNNQLTVPAVTSGSNIYFNAVGTVANLTSIGSVIGADKFDGTLLTIPYVLVGATPYFNVVLSVSLANVVAVHGGMPSVSTDQFNASTGQLTIPAVLVGSHVYTNVILQVALSNVISLGVTESVLHSFGGPGDGASPDGSLIQASDGNFYGMTTAHGAFNAGAVIMITPAGAESVLHSFGGTGTGDGNTPYGNLIQASDGNFYGMTVFGGTNNLGTVFKITPSGSETVLWSFGTAGDGATPHGSLIQGSDGNFYGMTSAGGTNNVGVVFKITPTGGESLLHSFAGGGDGINGYGSLIQASDGNFYGMTKVGGAHGAGAVIKITPTGTESVLYSFGAVSGDGFAPYGRLLQATDGNFYGMTYMGGANNVGIAFKITPTGSESILHSFGSVGDGALPSSSLIQARDGNFYGMTTVGGTYNRSAVIRITPDGTFSVLYSFGSYIGDGLTARGDLTQALDGNLYGMTYHGGKYGIGTVFRLIL